MQPWTEVIPQLYTRKTKTWIYNAWEWGIWMKPRLVMDISFIQIPTIDVEKLRIVCQKEMTRFTRTWQMSKNCIFFANLLWRNAEVEFVHPVSHGGSVKFVASGVNFSIFTNFLCFFLLKLLKLGEIGGVKFLTWKSGGVKFWTNSMSEEMCSKGMWSKPRSSWRRFGSNSVVAHFNFVFEVDVLSFPTIYCSQNTL